VGRVSVYEENLVAILREQKAWAVSCDLCGLWHGGTCLDHQLMRWEQEQNRPRNPGMARRM
jgi:hypothetical protein